MKNIKDITISIYLPMQKVFSTDNQTLIHIYTIYVHHFLTRIYYKEQLLTKKIN